MTGFKLSRSLLGPSNTSAHTDALRNVAHHLHHRAVTITGKAFTFLLHHEETIAFRDRKGVLLRSQPSSSTCTRRQ